MWEERERELLSLLEKNIGWYNRRATLNRNLHFAFSGVVIVCGVLSPLAAVSASGAVSGGAGAEGESLAVLGLSALALAQLSIVITIILGITEGLRRFWQFEQNWGSYYKSWISLITLLNAYRDGQVENEIGDAQWKENYYKARRAMEALVTSKTEEYFATMFTPATPAKT